MFCCLDVPDFVAEVWSSLIGRKCRQKSNESKCLQRNYRLPSNYRFTDKLLLPQRLNNEKGKQSERVETRLSVVAFKYSARLGSNVFCLACLSLGKKSQDFFQKCWVFSDLSYFYHIDFLKEVVMSRKNKGGRRLFQINYPKKVAGKF